MVGLVFFFHKNVGSDNKELEVYDIVLVVIGL